MSKVRIEQMPPGQAPEWVRKAWIGLELPIEDDDSEGTQMGVHGGTAENEGGYRVPTSEALSALEQKNAEAAQWWYDNLVIMPGWLVFSKTVCVPLEDHR